MTDPRDMPPEDRTIHRLTRERDEALAAAGDWEAKYRAALAGKLDAERMTDAVRGDLRRTATVAREEIDALRTTLSEISVAHNRAAADQDLHEQFVEGLIERLNPRDGDEAAEYLVTSAVEQVVAYVEAQPCACSEHELRSDPDAEPCDRCAALGRRNDKQVER